MYPLENVLLNICLWMCKSRNIKHFSMHLELLEENNSIFSFISNTFGNVVNAYAVFSVQKRKKICVKIKFDILNATEI